jgi:acyl-[acyl carrier protein]--UDP-N-acetylglucosamine O-acyltransferase
MAGIEIGIHVKMGQFAYAEENVKVNFGTIIQKSYPMISFTPKDS